MCLFVVSAATAINAATLPVVEETERMKKARLAGLDTRGKPIEPSFLRKHKELAVGGSSDAAVESGPVETGAFHPSCGFRRQDSVIGSTKHSMDWSYHSITPYDYGDIVLSSDLSRVEHMGAQAMATVFLKLYLFLFLLVIFFVIALIPFHVLSGQHLFPGSLASC